MLAAPPHAECGYYSITGNPVLDIALYGLMGLVALLILAAIVGFIVWIVRGAP